MNTPIRLIASAALTLAVSNFVAPIALAEEADTTASHKADDSARNKRDRNPDEVTAGQQKNNKTDIQITRDIRRAVIKDKELSTYAHNVKIIALNGAVTLKGPVRSADEKAKVEKLAVDTVGADKVTNQIEVKP